LGKGFGQNFANKFKFGTSLVASLCGPFGSNIFVFNHKQWHKSEVKHRDWDELIMYAKPTWKRVMKQIKISSFSAMALFHGFDINVGS
jgi:hypothetical protein